jgi:hypothetical protein
MSVLSLYLHYYLVVEGVEWHSDADDVDPGFIDLFSFSVHLAIMNTFSAMATLAPSTWNDCIKARGGAAQPVCRDHIHAVHFPFSYAKMSLLFERVDL